MKCGCQKTFCGTKVCKCKKNEVYCSDECGCPEEHCRNRQLPEPVVEEPESEEEPLEEPEPEAEPEQAAAGPSKKKKLVRKHTTIKERKEKKKEKKQGKKQQTVQMKWPEVLKQLEAEKDLMIELSHYNVMPQRLEVIMKKRTADYDEMKSLQQQMRDMFVEKHNAEALTAEEWKEFEMNLVQCRSCERKFHPERIAKHENICQRRTFTAPVNNRNDHHDDDTE